MIAGIVFLQSCVPVFAQRDERLPNFVIIYFDDLGYGDVGCYGSPGAATPNIDELASEGVRWSNFYAAAGYCSPSRAALLTGCYPQRVGIPQGLGGYSQTGLSPQEWTISRLLKSRGYSTACIGKWHLGDASEFLPLNHGFDVYFGLPYSNDMNYDPDGPINRYLPLLPLYRQETVIEQNPDQSLLTKRYVSEAVKFIEANATKPFFLYLPHTFPHLPLAASDDWKGKSGNGLYGDVIAELDWSVGEIVDVLDRLNLAEDTLVIVTSDNGPVPPGDTGGLRGAKGTTFEGGMRVPGIFRWIDRLPKGVEIDHVASQIDIYPTLAYLSGGIVGERPKIDGVNLWPWLIDNELETPTRDCFFYFQIGELQAVRSGRWKLHFPHDENVKDAFRLESNSIEMSLFDLEKDPGETTDIAEEHPEVVKMLKDKAEVFRSDLGDELQGVVGSGIRPPGVVPPWEPMGRKKKALLALMIAGAAGTLIVVARRLIGNASRKAT